MAHIASKASADAASITSVGPALASPYGKAVLGYLAALAMTAVATALAVGVEQVGPTPNLSLVFVLPVVIAGVSFGFGPSLAAAVLGALAFNFFLTEPRYSLAVDDPANVWAIGLLFLVGVIVSAVAFTSQRRGADATLLRSQASVLRDFSREVMAADGSEAIASTTAKALAALFGAPAAVLLVAGGEVVFTSKVGAIDLQAADIEAVRALAAGGGTGSRAGVYPELASRFDFWPIGQGTGGQAVIGLAFEPDERPEAPERVIDVVAALMALALQRQRGGSGR
jgi:two-component system sensor histidine kinase KdpD